MNIIETKLQEFEKLKLEEYGKWRIDRNVAKDFLRTAMLEVMETVLKEAEIEELNEDVFENIASTKKFSDLEKPYLLILRENIQRVNEVIKQQKQRHQQILNNYKTPKGNN